MDLCQLTIRAATGRGYKVLDIELASEREGDVVQLAFGGSDSRRDWRRNRDRVLTRWEGDGPGLVHWGFLESHFIVLPLSTKLVRGATEIEFAGHSQGGAVAVLVGLALHEMGHTVRKIVTYGAPRVGDLAFCADYPIPVERHVCGFDPVPYLPWWGYADLGPPIRLASRMSWRDKLNPWQWIRRDHCLFSYQQALEERMK